jgi:hypothetical protein
MCSAFAQDSGSRDYWEGKWKDARSFERADSEVVSC